LNLEKRLSASEYFTTMTLRRVIKEALEKHKRPRKADDGVLIFFVVVDQMNFAIDQILKVFYSSINENTYLPVI
jgi:hypothetical protein